MSTPSNIYPEIDEALYAEYVLWCRANKIPATLDGFSVWTSDQDLEEPEL